MQRLALAGHLDGVEIVRQHGAGGTASDGELVRLLQPAFAGFFAIIDALVEHVVLVAKYAGDRGPGGVVVRRLRLARHARRAVEREAPVGILSEVVDGARATRIVRKVRRRE